MESALTAVAITVRIDGSMEEEDDDDKDTGELLRIGQIAALRTDGVAIVGWPSIAAGSRRMRMWGGRPRVGIEEVPSRVIGSSAMRMWDGRPRVGRMESPVMVVGSRMLRV